MKAFLRFFIVCSCILFFVGIVYGKDTGSGSTLNEKKTHVALVTVKVTESSSSFGDMNILSGHAWIEIIRLQTMRPHSYGTWCDHLCTSYPQFAYGALHFDWEIQKNYQSTASRSLFVTQKQYDKLMELINKYWSYADDAWSLEENCTTFARAAWKAASGEKIDITQKHFPYPNPEFTKLSIVDLNDGYLDMTINECNSPYCQY